MLPRANKLIMILFSFIQMGKYPQNDFVVIHWLKVDGMGHIQSQKIFSNKIKVNQFHHWEIKKQIEKYLENDLGFQIEKYLEKDNRLLPTGLTHHVFCSSLWTIKMFRSHQMMIDVFNGY